VFCEVINLRGKHLVKVHFTQIKSVDINLCVNTLRSMERSYDRFIVTDFKVKTVYTQECYVCKGYIEYEWNEWNQKWYHGATNNKIDVCLKYCFRFRRPSKCLICGTTMSSRNKLFKHLQVGCKSE
jgi:hypothetical protein